MSRLVPLIAVVLPGCFYVDPINQRPSVEITQDSPDQVFRNSTVTLESNAFDPEGQEIKLTWRVYLCTDGTTPDGCDVMPYMGGVNPSITFTVPVMRADQPIDVESLRVVLEAEDDHGATAKPESVLVIPIGDAAPDLEVGKGSASATHVIGTPVNLFAKYGDMDDDLANLTIDWHVFTPSVSASFTLDDIATDPDPNDTTHVQKAKRFVPMATGSWDVQVTVTDPLGTATIGHIDVEVAPDSPPCIAAYDPFAPLDLDSPARPLSTATLFSVLHVVDDLDPFPSDPTNPDQGTTSFAWSLKGPGATTFSPLGVTSNGVTLDPAAYTVGDDLELRVDIADRIGTTLTCPDSDLTCAQDAGTSCIQRLTWRLEVR